MLCPCGSHQTYETCCGPYHSAQQTPQTPLALMRSRYSAYALALENYLLKTWHSSTRPKKIKIIDGKVWTKLEILDTAMDLHDLHLGYVEFIAHYQTSDFTQDKQQEKSRFIKEKGEWFYVDGVFEKPKLRRGIS